MNTKKIAIIGAGNMGKAIATRFLKKRMVSPESLILTNIDLSFIHEFKKQNVQITLDNRQAAEFADVIIFAVKPRDMRSTLYSVRDLIKNQLVISIAAGVGTDVFKRILGKDVKAVRVMPNIAAAIGESMSVWYKTERVGAQDTELIKTLLVCLGKEEELISEELIDAATAISGSGPAYIFYFAEILQKAGESLGFDKSLSEKLSRQTIIGAAELMKKTKETAEKLRVKVTSKGGTTEEAIKVLDEGNFEKIFIRAIKSAKIKAEKIRKTLTVAN